MHIAVLAARDSWYFRDLQRAAGDRYELSAVSYRSLMSQVQGGALAVQSGASELNGADGLLVRSMPPGSLEQVVFRMDALAQLELAGVTVSRHVPAAAGWAARAANGRLPDGGRGDGCT
jgi:hypothetical protein